MKISPGWGTTHIFLIAGAKRILKEHATALEFINTAKDMNSTSSKSDGKRGISGPRGYTQDSTA